jgi:hypothetical protein
VKVKYSYNVSTEGLKVQSLGIFDITVLINANRKWVFRQREYPVSASS